MNNEEQNIAITETRSDVKHIKESIDHMIESYNGKFRMIDDRITKDKKDSQKQLDNHCPRIRKIENRIIELQPSKKFYDKIRDFSVGIFVLLGGTIIAMASYIYHKIS